MCWFIHLSLIFHLMPLFEKDACWDALWRCKQLHCTIALLHCIATNESSLYCELQVVHFHMTGWSLFFDKSHARYNLHVICSCSVRHEDNEFEPEGLGIAVPGSCHGCGCGGADYIWHWALHCTSIMDVPSVILSGGISFAGDDVEPVFILEAPPNVKKTFGTFGFHQFLVSVLHMLQIQMHRGAFLVFMAQPNTFIPFNSIQ